jgi:hypothetical protein
VLGDLVNSRGDLHISRLHDLRAIAEKDLVAVVLRGIVRRSDHHAGHAAKMANAEGHYRCRQWPWCDHRLESRTRHDLRGVFGENIRVAPGIEADDHLAASKTMIKEVSREPGGRLSDDNPIHAIRSGTQRAAKPGRPELEPPGKGVNQLCYRSGVADVSRCKQILHLTPSLRVRVLHGPASNPAGKFFGEGRCT